MIYRTLSQEIINDIVHFLNLYIKHRKTNKCKQVLHINNI